MSRRAGESPSEVVADLWRRLAAEDYAGAAELHTEGFADYSRVNAIRDGTPRVYKPRTAEELLERSPDMPRAVAEWNAAQYRKQPAMTGFFGSVHGVESLEELKALTSREVLARRIQAADWRTRLRPHLDELAEAHPQYRDQLMQKRAEARSQWSGRVAGHVISTGRAYVILDEPLDPAQVAQDWGPTVVVLRQSAAGWRVSSDLAAGNGLVHFHIAVTGPDGEDVVLS